MNKLILHLEAWTFMILMLIGYVVLFHVLNWLAAL